MAKQRKIREVTSGQGTKNQTQAPITRGSPRVDALARKVEAERKTAEQRAAGLAEPGTTEIP